MHHPWRATIAGLTLGLSFVPSALSKSDFQGQILTSDSQLLPTYDYVIVGAGVSGLTVANRLSENPSKLANSLRSAPHVSFSYIWLRLVL
jgi:cation diffusion facilitator CzcD-associated flavoprotein CzcO